MQWADYVKQDYYNDMVDFAQSFFTNTANAGLDALKHLDTTYTNTGTQPSSVLNTIEQSSKPSMFAHPAEALQLLAGNILTPPGQLIDAALMTLRGGAKAVSPLLNVIDPYSEGDTPIGTQLAQGAEQNIPEPFAANAMADFFLGGRREALEQQAGPIPGIAGQLLGAIGTGVGLAKFAPSLFGAFDLATDVASGFPGAAVMQGAKTLPGMIGRGAAVGFGSSVLPAVDLGYNAMTGEADPMAAASALGFGTVLGGAIPAGLGGLNALSGVAKTGATQGKQMLRQLVEGTQGMIQQSDTTKIMREMSQAAYQRQQMQTMNEGLTRQVDAQYAPKVETEVTGRLLPEDTYRGEGVGEQTIVPRAVQDLQAQTEPPPVSKSGRFVTESGLEAPLEGSFEVSPGQSPKLNPRSTDFEYGETPTMRAAARTGEGGRIEAATFQAKRPLIKKDQSDKQLVMNYKLNKDGDIDFNFRTVDNKTPSVSKLIKPVLDWVSETPLGEVGRRLDTYTETLRGIDPKLGREFKRFANRYNSRPSAYIQEAFGDDLKSIEKLFKKADASVLFNDKQNSQIIAKQYPEIYKLYTEKIAPFKDKAYGELTKYYPDDFGYIDRKPGEIIVARRVKDIDGLKKALGKDWDADFQTLKQEYPGTPEHLLADRLMRRRKITITPELEKYYYTPLEGEMMILKDLAHANSLGEFLGKIDRTHTATNIAESLTNKFPNLNEKQRAKAERYLLKYFSDYKGAKQEPLLGLISGINRVQRATLLSGPQTAFVQTTIIPRLMARMDPSVISEAGQFGKKVDPTKFIETLSNLADDDIYKLIDPKTLHLDFLGELNLNNDTYKFIQGYEDLMLLLAKPMMKGEASFGLAASHKWVENNAKQFLKTGKIQDPKFKIFLDKWYSPEEQLPLLEKIATRNKKIENWLDAEDIMDITLTAATERGGLVLGKSDKPIFGSNQGQFSSLLMNLLSFAAKESSIAKNSITDALKAGDVNTALYAALVEAPVVAASGAAVAMIYKMLYDKIQGNPGQSQEYIDRFTEDVKQKGLQEVFFGYNDIMMSNLIDGKWDKILVESLIKGASRGESQVKFAGNITKDAIEAKLKGYRGEAATKFTDVYNPDVNPTLTRGGLLMPGYVSEALQLLGPDAWKQAGQRRSAAELEMRYARSPEAKAAEGYKQESTVSTEQLQQIPLIAKGQSPMNTLEKLNPKLAHTIKVQQELDRAKESRIGLDKYGTQNPLEKSKREIRSKEFERRNIETARDVGVLLQNNAISSEQAHKILQQAYGTNYNAVINDILEGKIR